MTVSSIWTLRRLKHQVFRQIIEEWEDDFAAQLSLPLIDTACWEECANSLLGVAIRRKPRFFWWCDDALRVRRSRAKECGLAFLIWPPSSGSSYLVQSDVIPIVVDFWAEQLKEVETIFALCRAIIVTNSELLEPLADTKLANKVHFVPLSVSARHICKEVPAKTLDLIQVGRYNQVLHDWALRYVRERPLSDYFYVRSMSGYTPQWMSAKSGSLDVDNSRQTYLNLLRSARVSLVATPGIDGGKVRTDGFNPVTPRFYESAASRCHLIGRFPADGTDIIQNRVASVCQNVTSYDAFKVAIDGALQSLPDLNRQNDFLAGHTASEVAELVREILTNSGFAFLESVAR